MEPIILPRISDQKPLVSVVSITYNHEPYIKDCLEGFLMQKTDFPIEVVIHDDASTDHTADIIREYYKKRPDIFHVIIEKENLYSKGKPILAPLFYQAQGKYIAVCEGDDYWTDSLKLQKQFDFMENHPDYTMCGTHKLIWYQNTRKTTRRRQRSGEITIKQIMAINPFATCTTFFCKTIILDWMKIWANINKTRWKVEDLPLLVYCLSRGNGFIIPDITSCYRVLEKSASHGDYDHCISGLSSCVHIRLYLNKILNLNYPSENILKGYAVSAVRHLLICGKNSPRTVEYYRKMYKKVSGNQCLSFKNRLTFLIAKYIPRLSFKLLNILR